VGTRTRWQDVAYAWTFKHRHHGNITTLKLESAHKEVKSCLLHSQGHLIDVVDKIVNYFETHFREYSALLADQFITIDHAVNVKKITEWEDDLNEWITPSALKLCRQQLEKARNNEMLPTCSGRFEAMFGIPCCHDQRIWIRLGRLVKASDFNPHWLWEREGVATVFDRSEAEARAPRPTIFDPRIMQGKGRATEVNIRQRDTSTRRDPSLFDLTDPNRTTRRTTTSRTPDQSQTGGATPAPISRSNSQTPALCCPPARVRNLAHSLGQAAHLEAQSIGHHCLL
jgi:hypothetical protein